MWWLLGSIAALLLYGAPFLPDIPSMLRALYFAFFRPHQRMHPRTECTTAMISVVVPCRNESATIAATVRSISGNALQPELVQVILAVDPSSHDDTLSTARAVAVRQPHVRVVSSASAGRGCSLRTGIAAADGSLLLMLHADTQLPETWDRLLRETLADSAVIMCAFRFELDRAQLTQSEHFYMRSVERSANWRSQYLWLPYGDQALGITRKDLEGAGGVPEQVMMEDFELVCRLRRGALRNGRRIAIIDAVARCNPRRWEQKGVFKTLVLNWVFVFGYVILGQSAEQIHQMYY